MRREELAILIVLNVLFLAAISVLVVARIVDLRKASDYAAPRLRRSTIPIVSMTRA